MTTPDLLTTLTPRQDRLPIDIPHARSWCPARNCPHHCGPRNCTCQPCHRKPRCLDPARASHRTHPQPVPHTYQPSLFHQPTQEVKP